LRDGKNVLSQFETGATFLASISRGSAGVTQQ
jgi:hypothetical protein